VQARRPKLHAGDRAIGYREPSMAPLPDPLPATLVAFYLPQFHPVPENDAWWGEGFTEWRNVTRALPQFEGHAQPRLPGTLGFYDLRLPEVMRQQMALAREHGIGAFCSYFYWFAGQTLLEQPLRQWLDDASLHLPLCLCWANENWSRRWDGRADQVLIAQRHSPEDDLAFIAHVAAYLRDPRYLRIDGRPLLLVYRPGLLPDPAATAARWRLWCAKHGIGEIHLAYVQSFDNMDPRSIGFDSAVAFPPNNISLSPVTAQQQLLNPGFRGDVLDWRELARDATAKPDPDYLLHPCVNPGWDNEPRRSGAGRVFVHASPRGYRDWLRRAIAVARRREPGKAAPLVFINAWNEWAEGAVLEPDALLGHAWLQATRNAMRPCTVDPRPCAVIHAWYADVLDEIIQALRDSGISWRMIVTVAPEREAQVRACLIKQDVDAEIAVFENRGRDVLPFLHVADRLLDEGIRVVLKLHTKRSTHRQDGDTWRRDIVEKLLAPERARRILTAFKEGPDLGLVAAEGHLQPLSHYWGANATNVDYLCRRLGIAQPSAERDMFIAGTMFWVNLDAIRPLLDSQLGLWEFEDETGQVDGTMAHAVERSFMLVAADSGLQTRSAAEVCGLPDSGIGDSTPYAYAKRSG
jgi:lipopolysaccharide biosynthesis protein